jgi:hypothetical protein
MVDSDQEVVNRELSLCLCLGVAVEWGSVGGCVAGRMLVGDLTACESTGMTGFDAWD